MNEVNLEDSALEAVLARARAAAEEFGDDEAALSAAVKGEDDGVVYTGKTRRLHDIDVSAHELKSQIRHKFDDLVAWQKQNPDPNRLAGGGGGDDDEYESLKRRLEAKREAEEQEERRRAEARAAAAALTAAEEESKRSAFASTRDSWFEEEMPDEDKEDDKFDPQGHSKSYLKFRNAMRKVGFCAFHSCIRLS